MLLGLVLSAAAVILAGMFDDNIRSEDYLAQAYPEIPLLAVIPDMVGGKHSGGYYRYGGSGYYGYGGYYRKSSTGKIDEKTGNQTIPKQGEQKRA